VLWNPRIDRLRYAYSQRAAAAGIEMTETRLVHDGALAHVMTKRFDRVGNDRVHVHSLGGLHHVDYNARGAFSYEAFFRTLRTLGLGQAVVDQAYRRMAFNLAAVNQDDHVKNIGFLMTPAAGWTLAPAYDVTFAHGNVWTRTHQMTLAGKDDGFTPDDLLRVGAMMDVPRDGADILNEIESALGLWEPEAAAAAVPRRWVRHILGLFRHFDQ
jgi:serine/threonine-protein kinase HipA